MEPSLLLCCPTACKDPMRIGVPTAGAAFPTCLRGMPLYSPYTTACSSSSPASTHSSNCCLRVAHSSISSGTVHVHEKNVLVCCQQQEHHLLTKK